MSSVSGTVSEGDGTWSPDGAAELGDRALGGAASRVASAVVGAPGFAPSAPGPLHLQPTATTAKASAMALPSRRNDGRPSPREMC